ncbi:MAG: hypothetical protein UX60_C0038G0010, partial [Berkelbacteria bacterium GW2011_GWA2_46_7]
EARKYRLNLAMANQYTAQMPESVSNAVFGNVGTMISFRVGAQDADALVKEYEPVFDANDLVNLDNYQIYLKMAIDGVTVPAFSAGTLPPKLEKTNLVEQIVANSRQMYSRPVEEVEDYITEWSTPINLSDPSKQPISNRLSERDTSEATIPQPHEELKTKPDAFAGQDGGAGNQETEQTENGGVATQADIESDPVVESTEIATQSGGVAPVENTPPTTEGGGGASENDQLISWDDAEQLGIQVQMEPNSSLVKSADDQGLTPLDEIR